MVGWHHRLNGHEFEQASGVGDGQGNLVRGVGKVMALFFNMLSRLMITFLPRSNRLLT